MTPAEAAPTMVLEPEKIISLVKIARLLAIDLETTGLDPRTDRVRLISVSAGGQTGVWDCFAYDPQPLLESIREANPVLVAHHAAFDLGFLWHLGLRDIPETVCTYLQAQVLTAGSYGYPSLSLKACCERWLKLDLPKELQTSDWSSPDLSPEQLAYAARDAEVLFPLFRVLNDEIKKSGLSRCAEIELKALPAWVWLCQSGVPFDRTAWLALEAKAQAAKARLEDELDEAAPKKGGKGLFGFHERWNWNSPKQVTEVFHRLGIDLMTTADAQLALIQHPVADLLREHRHRAQLVKMYGQNWLEKARIHKGRVYPGWRQIGTATGRTSCESPNMQQIPRDEDPDTKRILYKTCCPAPPGRALVKADYSTLQMRIACKYARDVALLNVFLTDGDPHTATAQALLGKSDVTKLDRQIAKSANFALLFGAGAEGLRQYAKTTYGIDLTEDEAARHRSAFFARYSGLAAWHQQARRQRSLETRSTTGRRRLLATTDPDTFRLNSPVQADEADGLKRALAFLWQRRAEVPSACPILVVHDEIVIECDQGEAGRAKVWLEEAMLDGMAPLLDPVPCRVEAKIVSTWGG